MKPTVMIVEDEASLVTMLRYNLEKEGYNVTEASDGEEAVTVVSHVAPKAMGVEKRKTQKKLALFRTPDLMHDPPEYPRSSSKMRGP